MSASAPPPPTRIGSRTFEWGSRTYVMGIVNVTPDSFAGAGLKARTANDKAQTMGDEEESAGRGVAKQRRVAGGREEK